MAKRVFKIPDGQGGISYQVQTPDGQWHITDEEGNFLPEQTSETPQLKEDGSAGDSFPLSKGSRRRRKKETIGDDGYVNFSMALSREQHRLISDYILWKRLCTGKGTMAELFISAVISHIRKDKEFKLFKERNGF